MRSLLRSSACALVVVWLAGSLLGCSDEGPAGAPPIVVEGASGRAVIERSPFGLRFENIAGQTVLALAATARPEKGIFYAPLSISVGDEPELRVPVLPDVPDENPPMTTDPRCFAASAVLDATVDGGAVVASLSTTDPDGRTLTLRIGLEGEDAFAVSLDASGPGVTAVAATFASGPDEAFHGFGGRRESTDLRGRTIKSWVLDYRFPDVSQAYYDVAPDCPRSSPTC